MLALHKDFNNTKTAEPVVLHLQRIYQNNLLLKANLYLEDKINLNLLFAMRHLVLLLLLNVFFCILSLVFYI